MTIVMLLKASLYACLFATFFLIFSVKNWQILVLSRTAAVTMATYIFVTMVLTFIYGKYDIGKRKSKPIINSLVLASMITDIFTYLILQIMNTNPVNNNQFRLMDLWLLPIVMIVQVAFIVLFTYLGNYLFFLVNPPEKCIIITSSQQSLNEVARGIHHYKKQYEIKYAVDYRRENIYKLIMECDTVFLYDVPMQQRTEFLDFCYHNSRNVYFNPEIADVVEINSKHIMLDDVSLIADYFKELTPEQKLLKRLSDIVICLMCMVVALPIMFVCAIAIKLDDGGKVFFRQKRATKDGDVFNLLKFRTMREKCENYSATEDDDRITRVGHFLRKYRIDELPQLFNILKGDMSIVGPRPEMLSNIYEYTKVLPEFQYRLRVKAGLTGYAQIMGKYNTTPKDKLILDLMYIESYSLWKDFQLIFQTLIVLLKAEDSTEGFKKLEEAEFTDFEKDGESHE